MRPTIIAAIALLLAALVLSQCSRNNDPTAKLEELPKESAEKLQKVGDSDDFFVSVPLGPAIKSPPPKSSPKPGVIFAQKKCAEQKLYRFYVLYPVTICHRPTLDPQTLPVAGFFKEDPKAPAVPTDTLKPSNFKLSSFQGRSFTAPYFCRTRSGPWGAEMAEKQSCDEVNLVEYFLSIPGVAVCPNCPSFYWTGTAEDHPAAVRFVDYTGVFQDSVTVDCDLSDLTNCGGGDSPPTTPGPIF